MRSFVLTPSLLRTFVLGSLGLSLQACSDPAAERSVNAQGGQGPTGGAAGATSVVGGSGGVGGRGTGGATSTKLPSVCTEPQPVLPGVDTGVFQCKEGYLHRAEARACGSTWPRDLTVTLPAPAPAPAPAADAGGDSGIARDAGGASPSGECTRDSDCAKDAFCTVVHTYQGPCARIFPDAPSPPPPEVKCQQGCRVDADCGPSAVCLCGPDIGFCADVSTTQGCHTDADCDGGQCLQNARTDTFGPVIFACQLPGDSCTGYTDCQSPQFCAFDATGRSCKGGAVCGRPFLVEGAARLASARRSGAWLESGNADLPVPADPALAAHLAEHWMRIGLMEHASIAAFARFTLQLLSLGAPMELVRDAGAAQADETRHAVMAFALASSYAGTEVGPGPLDLSGVLERESVEQILRTTIREGCLGETFAAIEASEAARSATVPHLKATLESIAADESAHAALAWRVVQWILGEHPEFASVARDEFALAGAVMVEGGRDDEGALEGASEHGVLGAVPLARVRSAALREVVLPCARALLGSLKTTARHQTFSATGSPPQA